jgi:large subunit ribosomal protein L7/L12
MKEASNMQHDWSPTVVEIGDRIVSLTMAEAAQLNSYLDEVHGIRAVQSTIVSIGTQPDYVVDRGHVTPTQFDVVLVNIDPSHKIAAIKAVRQATMLGLKEAKELVDGAPRVVKERLSRQDAEDLEAILASAGAKATIRPTVS